MIDMPMKHITVIIPAYKPSEKLIGLINKLSQKGFSEILLINDGSGSEFDDIFFEAKNIKGVKLLNHAINMGKGRALKTAINYYLTTALPHSIGIVTADADGQHLPADIQKVCQRMLKSRDIIVLGSRKLDKGTPFKSRFGNTLTRFVFRIASGIKIYDTQTGLRAIPKEYLERFLSLQGERYEYEMAMLLELNNLDLAVEEVIIATIYEDNNRGSHFNAIKDSWKIYKLIFGFAGSSLISAVVDILFYSYFFYIVFNGNLLLSVVLARGISSLVNFGINRKVLLSKHNSNQTTLVHLAKYYILVVVILGASYSLTYLLGLLKNTSD